MRPFRRLIALTLTLAALGSLAAISTAGGQVAAPRLFVISTHPLTIAGRHFKPHSHVRVTLSSARQVSKRVAVNGNGRFTVGFASTAVDRCTQWLVKASQTGRTSVLLRGPRPQCAPAGTS